MPDFELLDPNKAVDFAIWVIALLVVMILAFALFGWLLFKAGQLSHPAPLIVSLSVLTSVALVGGMATGSVEALTLAATGLGALAGSLSAVYTSRPRKLLPEEDDQ